MVRRLVLSSFCSQSSGVWARIVDSIFHLHSSGIVPLSSIRFNLGDGSLIRFWKDIWLGDVPLCSRFNRLFHLDRNKDCLVKDRYANGDCDGAVQVFLRFPPRKIGMFGISLGEPLETKSFKPSLFLPLLVGCYGALETMLFFNLKS
nr:RNA-directed DNA polymerase, eukaryota, reverse transcriptase zinc-binding domain protein [Tanacetum cinerariifolium]